VRAREAGTPSYIGSARAFVLYAMDDARKLQGSESAGPRLSVSALNEDGGDQPFVSKMHRGLSFGDRGERPTAKTSEHAHGRPQSPSGSYQFDMDAFESALRDKGILQEFERTFNLIAVPLLIMAVIGIGSLLVWAEEILVPFVIALFLTYLLKPMVNALSQPLGACSETNCIYFFSASNCRRRMTQGSYFGVLGPRKDSTNFLGESEFEEFEYNVPDSCGDSEEVELSTLIDDGSLGTSGAAELRSRGPHASVRSAKVKAPTMTNPKSLCFRCRHAKCPRWFAIFLCMVLFIGFFAGVVIFIADAVQTFEDEDLEQYEDRMAEIAFSLKVWLKSAFGLEMKNMLEEFKSEFQWAHLTKTMVVSVLNGLEYMFLIFLFVLYMLFEDSETSSHEHSINSSHSRARDLRKQIDHQIQRYLVIKTLISLCVGISVYVVLGPILGVKMAHIFGVITFFANYIPNVGAMLATCVPVPLVILDPDQTAISAILAIVLPVSIHAIVGNLIEPKVFGDTMELHPVVVLISLSFWYTVWGIPGAILSVPITAVMRIFLSNISHPYASVALCVLEGKLPGSRAFHGND